MRAMSKWSVYTLVAKARRSRVRCQPPPPAAARRLRGAAGGATESQRRGLADSAAKPRSNHRGDGATGDPGPHTTLLRSRQLRAQQVGCEDDDGREQARERAQEAN